jgi:lipoprotein-anchoring transpeptidase ErfK/SrfK
VRARHRSLGQIVLGLVFVLLTAGCATTDGSRRTSDAAVTPQPSTATTTTLPPILPGDGPHAATPTSSSLDLYEQPGADAAVDSMSDTNAWDGANVFAVRDAVYAGGEPWVEIDLPRKPNESTAWARASDLEVEPLDYSVAVSLDERRLEVRDGEEVVRVFPVAIGTEETPTPLGEFYVTVKLQPPQISDVYGRWALGLSGYSDVLDQFGTGDGQIAIHGTESIWTIGTPASNGCLRLTNDAISELADLLPKGTPVTITA